MLFCDRSGDDLAESCSLLPREPVVLSPFGSAWIFVPATDQSESVLTIHVNAFPAKSLFDLRVVEIVVVLPSPAIAKDILNFQTQPLEQCDRIFVTVILAQNLGHCRKFEVYLN